VSQEGQARRSFEPASRAWTKEVEEDRVQGRARPWASLALMPSMSRPKPSPLSRAQPRRTGGVRSNRR